MMSSSGLGCIYPSDQGEGANVPTLVRRLHGGEVDGAPNNTLLSGQSISSDLIIQSTMECSMVNLVTAGEHGARASVSGVLLESSLEAAKDGTHC